MTSKQVQTKTFNLHDAINKLGETKKLRDRFGNLGLNRSEI
jgi:hypothetical protein